MAASARTVTPYDDLVHTSRRAQTGWMNGAFVTVTDVAGIREIVGQELGPTPWTTISQEQVDRFADVVHDRHWAHNEPEVAATGPFGGTIGHAHLTLSLLPSLFFALLAIEDGGSSMFYGYDRVRFPAPVPVGSRLRMRGKVARLDEVGGALQLCMAMTVEIDTVERPACVADAIWRHYPLAAPG